MNKTPFYHISLTILNSHDVLSEIDKYLIGNNKHTVLFINAHCFNLAAKDLEYQKIINNSDLILNDGVGVEIASRFAGIHLKENLNGTDLIPRIIELASNKNQKIFLLGAKNDVVTAAKTSLEKMFPGICIVGTSSGYFDDDFEVIREINDSRADILIVGMGVPLQEKWIAKNLESMEFVKVFVAGGAIFDFLSGRFKRAPVMVQKLKMEWLVRLIQEPNRLFGRYFLGTFLLFFNMIKSRK